MTQSLNLDLFDAELNWRYLAAAEAAAEAAEAKEEAEAEAEAAEADRRNNDAETVFTAKLTVWLPHHPRRETRRGEREIFTWHYSRRNSAASVMKRQDSIAIADESLSLSLSRSLSLSLSRYMVSISPCPLLVP